MRPIFSQGDLVAIDVSVGGIITPDYAKNLFKLFGATFIGSRSLVAAHYNRPQKPPRFRGRAGLHIRAATFDVGNVRLSTEMGTDIMVLAAKLGAMSKSDRLELQKVALGGVGKVGGSFGQDVDELADLVIPDDPGISILGKVVGWIGSSREPQLQQESKTK
jgi:hypothetical protein